MKHLLILLLLATAGCSRTTNEAAGQAETQPAPAYYEIGTPLGRLVVRLYDETPLHRDNFKKLVAEGFYNGTTFHRVIAGYMIQGGDPNSKDEDPYNDGNGGPGYTVPAEFNRAFFHKRGALVTARQPDQVNPERRSSGSQFFIVQGGRPFDAAMLDQMEEQIRRTLPDPNFTFSPEARAAYTTDGGAPQLDMQYSVFGELIEGFDVLDRIATTQTPRSTAQPAHPVLTDRPLQHIPMTIRPLPDYQPPAR